jgi:hypothetical protein
MRRIVREQRGSFAIPILYMVILLLSLQLLAFAVARYWVQVIREDIQTKLDMSSMASYPNLNLENLAETASVTLETAEAKKTFESVLAKQLEIDPVTLAPLPSSPVERLQIDKFKIYQSSEVPARLADGRMILHSPAIESQITVHIRLPFLDRNFPFTFHSVTDLPQTP